ncbi:hypothetical protein Tco_0715196 [Tanacetum coccineum]
MRSHSSSISFSGWWEVDGTFLGLLKRPNRLVGVVEGAVKCIGFHSGCDQDSDRIAAGLCDSCYKTGTFPA